MRNVFGWDLPPGCTQRHIDEAMGTENPCAVCGQWEDACICPECPMCGNVGDPECYSGGHGLFRSPEQIAMRAAAEAQWEADVKAINEAEEASYLEWRRGLDEP